MARSRFMVKIIEKFFPSRFKLAKMTNYPIIGKLIDRWFFEEDDMVYIPKDNVIELNRDIELPDNIVLPSKIVEHFIEEANYHWIMDFCICRESMDCDDYPIELGCLFLGEAAKNINPELGREVTKEEAHRHVERCKEAGLVQLIGRNKLDPVWLDVGPGEKLMTICNCCPCCCLWKMLPDLSPDIGGKIKKLPGVEVKVTKDCTGCGRCTEGVCFVDAIRIEDGKAVINDDCRGCGRCVEACPNDAIVLDIMDEDFYTDSIENLEAKIDIK